MAKVRSIPRFRRLPSFRNAMMVDTFRGVLRVRKWPKKRGPPKSEAQRYWVDWFKQANRLAKYADGLAQVRAIELTAGTGLYPRDVMLSAMRGRLYVWADQDGWKWYPVAAIQDISDSLDVLAQTVGSVLVRATDRWRAPPPGAVGDVLQYQGAAAPPVWATLTPGAGVVTQQLTGTPVVVDNTVALYEFDVTAYAQVIVTYDKLVFAASDHPLIRLSYDNGATFKAGATDYQRAWVDAGGDGAGDVSSVFTTAGNSTGIHRGVVELRNLRAGRLAFSSLVGDATNGGRSVFGMANFDSPVTNIRIFSGNGNNFKTGTLRLVGLAAA